MLVDTVDTESFRERLMDGDFYCNWRQSVGEEAWARMEAKSRRGPMKRGSRLANHAPQYPVLMST